MGFDWKMFAGSFLEQVTEGIEEKQEEAKKYRGQLIEEVASYVDNLLEKYMEDEAATTKQVNFFFSNGFFIFHILF